MIFSKTPLEGSFLISPVHKVDERGFFSRIYCCDEFEQAGLNTSWLQVNNSFTSAVGTLRGLHLQVSPCQEIKLVRCINGSVWDVIVDLRPNSATFGKWFATELNDKNRTMVYIPGGFAHGFISLTADSELLYLVSSRYAPDSERTLLWNDMDVNIEWPVLPTLISDKDKSGLLLKDLNLL
jgi:dTDP-4-dehydrorhamnose 3,5-epimerase